jgi:hypothetical protein
MPSGEKAGLRASMARDLATEIEGAIESAERNRVALSATRDASARIVERFTQYRKRIDAAFEDGTFEPEAREPVLAVFRDLVTIVDQLRRQTEKRVEEVAPFVLGLRKAHSLAAHAESREERVVLRAAREEEEEEEYRADLAERLPPSAQSSVNAPEPSRESEEPSHGSQEAREEPEEAPEPEEPSEPESASPAPPAAADLCSHCEEPISIPTGSKICAPCVSHRNRYGALPSERALSNRRARSARADS